MKKIISYFPIILVLILTSCVSAKNRSDMTFRAMQRESFRKESIAKYPEAAKQANISVEYYEKGQYIEARSWLQKSADQGFPLAQLILGTLYEEGKPEQDYGKAVYWYERAAQQGFMMAENNLGGMYLLGKGVPKDRAKACYWYKRAAAHGDEHAVGTIKWSC